MKTNPPIKRSKSLVWLSRDHHNGLLVVWKIRQGLRFGVSTVRINNFVISAFESELETHFLEEENLLFIKLPMDPLRLRAESEHAAIRKMTTNLNNEEPNALHLQNFANLLEEHIRFEERILFPY